MGRPEDSGQELSAVPERSGDLCEVQVQFGDDCGKEEGEGGKRSECARGAGYEVLELCLMEIQIKKHRMKTAKILKNFTFNSLCVLAAFCLLLLYLILQFVFIIPAFISHKYGNHGLSLVLAEIMMLLKDIIVSILD